MNKLLLMLVLMSSSPIVLAHGSSHPSCTDINTGVRYKRDDNAYVYDVCKAERSAYRAEQHRLCMAATTCKAEKDARNFRTKVLLWTLAIFVILIFLLMILGI